MKVYKLNMLGTFCIFMSIDDLLYDIRESLSCDDDLEMSIHAMEMTLEEYEALPEFQGW